MTGWVRWLHGGVTDERPSTVSALGGKGASLVRLADAGFPVPDGFVITTEAYRRFLDHAGLPDRIDQARTRPPSQAARRIAELITKAELPPEVDEAVRWAYRDLGSSVRVAVRSSATAEDLPGLSFAGQQDTLLDVSTVPKLIIAIKRCWASLWSARAIAYRAEHRVAEDDLAIAVVVQQMVHADAAGVMFTLDPVTGADDAVIIDAAWGLGEAVVSGEVTPDRYRIDRSDAVSADLHQDPPTLSSDQARRLAGLARRIEDHLVGPADIEWARVGEEVSILQARPVTSSGRSSAGSVDPWNDSRGVHCLWTSGNVGEAIPDTMTPATWSLVEEFLADAMPTTAVPPYVAFGIVGGRLYFNLSMFASIGRCAGVGERLFRALTRDVFGRLPDDLRIPYLKLPPARVLRLVMPVALSMTVHARADARKLPAYLRDHPERCRQLRRRIAEVDDPTDLARLWTEVIHPEFHQATGMLTAATRSDGPVLVTIRRSLQKSMGPVQAERLLAGLGRADGQLASLGPLIGLEELADGTIDAATFTERYGHRGPHEFEISEPRPAEDAGWLERSVAEQRQATYSVSELLHRQEQARTDAWQQFARDHPHKVISARRKIDRWIEISRNREQARSEVVRFFWVLRDFWARAGDLSGIGADVFSYDRAEVVALLSGRRLEAAELRARQRAYRAYAELPPYPSVILGQFDPFSWATDPGRATGVFVEGETTRPSPSASPSVKDALSGFPGSSGVVEGVVRILTDTRESDQFRTGDVLVTSVTNVGWTPLFPRARAVITDVGAPLSHAAIVARELGIPAVVGCGDATSRLHTGDRVRVNGTEGTVEVLERAA